MTWFRIGHELEPFFSMFQRKKGWESSLDACC